MTTTQDSLLPQATPEDIEDRPVYHQIKTVTTMTGLTERRIRLYEQASGTPVPREMRGAASYRMFSPADIFALADYKRTIGEGETLPRPITASVYLPKGGAGKSTLSTELSVLWQLNGLRVLLVDLDPQASSTVIFGYEPEADSTDFESYGMREDEVVQHTFADLLSFQGVPGHHVVKLSEALKMPYSIFGPHLIPSDVNLAGIFYNLDKAANRDRRIEAWVRQGRENPTPALDLTKYDIILFDNAPATSVLSRAALVASDFCIAPVRLDALSAKSLSFVSGEFESLLEATLPCPELIAVPTFHSPQTSRSKQIMAGLWTKYAEAMVDSRVRASEIFPKSLLKTKPRDRMPVSLQHPKHPVVRDDLVSVAAEILTRFKEVAARG